MSIASLRRVVALSLLGLILAAPGAWAAEARMPDQPWQAARLAEAARGFLGLFWGTLTSVWEKNGATIDPNGVNGPGNGLAGDNGATIDPSGDGLIGNEGATIDPNGDELAEDEGATIDPDGR
jgi:hypothetical protein